LSLKLQTQTHLQFAAAMCLMAVGSSLMRIDDVGILPAIREQATLHPQPYTLHPIPSTLNPQPSTLNAEAGDASRPPRGGGGALWVNPNPYLEGFKPYLKGFSDVLKPT